MLTTGGIDGIDSGAYSFESALSSAAVGESDVDKQKLHKVNKVTRFMFHVQIQCVLILGK